MSGFLAFFPSQSIVKCRLNLVRCPDFWRRNMSGFWRLTVFGILTIEEKSVISLDFIFCCQKDLFSKSLKRYLQLPREVQDPDAVTSFHENGKLEPLLNMIEFGSSELSNYNDRLEDEIKQRKMLNLHLNLFKKKLDQEQKSETFLKFF